MVFLPPPNIRLEVEPVLVYTAVVSSCQCSSALILHRYYSSGLVVQFINQLFIVISSHIFSSSLFFIIITTGVGVGRRALSSQTYSVSLNARDESLSCVLLLFLI